MSILKVWQVLPKGLYVDSALAVARKELAWEVDYKREAACSKKFRLVIVLSLHVVCCIPSILLLHILYFSMPE